MSLTALTATHEISAARITLLANLSKGCRSFRRKIGWQGGNEECDVNWNSAEGFWTSAGAFLDQDRWVIFFGTDNPEEKHTLAIVCEVNPPKEGINRNCAGVFIQDVGKSGTYLAHTGKLGGGQAGVGRTEFRRHYRGTWEQINWRDGKATEAIVIGRIDSPFLASQVANFVREVARFKAGIRSQSFRAQSTFLQSFNPEFSGQRRGYRIQSDIESHCDHGIVVNALAKELQTMGFDVANDQNRDLFVYSPNGQLKLLFEAKTDVNVSMIYQGIGQLLFHSAEQCPPPHLFLVLPAQPNLETKRVLIRLGIQPLIFRWEGKQPIFENLEQFVK